MYFTLVLIPGTTEPFQAWDFTSGVGVGVGGGVVFVCVCRGGGGGG